MMEESRLDPFGSVYGQFVGPSERCNRPHDYLKCG